MSVYIGSFSHIHIYQGSAETHYRGEWWDV